MGGDASGYCPSLDEGISGMSACVLERINAMDRASFLSVFGALYEHSPWIAGKAWDISHPFAFSASVYEEMKAVIAAATEEQKLRLVREHPELARRAGVDLDLTKASQSEQASAGLDRLTPDEYAHFNAVNGAYAERFGMPFVICVRLSDKQHIMSEMERRLTHSPQEELVTALGEIDKIAALRFSDVLEQLEKSS